MNIVLKNKIIVKFLILFASQIIFYVSNIVTTRMLLKTYGIDFLGEVSYFFVTTSIITTILNFGLPLYGQLTINISKKDHVKSQHLFKVFFHIRFTLLLFVLLFIFVLSFFGVLKNGVLVYLVLFSFVYTFYIDWYLIGKENYATLASAIFLGKGLQLVALIYFISFFNSPFLIYLLEILSILLITLSSNVLSAKNLKYKNIFSSVYLSDIKFHFMKLSNSFLSFMGVAVYTTLNAWFLSYTVSNHEFGLFSIADKYFLMVNGASAIFFRVLFLNNAQAYRTSVISISNIFLLLIIPAVTTVLSYFLQEKICILLFGYYDQNISVLINLFLVAYFFNQISLIFSNLLVIRGLDKKMQNAFLVSAALVVFGYFSIQFLNIAFTPTQSIFLTIFGNIFSSLLLLNYLYKNYYGSTQILY